MLKREPLISIKKGKLPYININNQINSIIIIIAFSAVLSVIGLMLGDVMSFPTIKRFLMLPLLFVLNTIPLTLLMLFIYFATSRIWSSYVLGGGFFIFVELINRFKIELRDDPLIPADILLGGEVANVVKLSELNISKYLVAMIILFFLAALLLILFLKSSKLKAIGRISGALACLLIFNLTFNYYYKDVKRYEKYPVRGFSYASSDIFRSRGFIYSFLSSFESLKVRKPEGYSKNEAIQLLKKYDMGNTAAEQKKPNVIAIMGEAFYNLDRIPGAKFAEGMNPLENFNNVIKESYHGSIVTSVFGGGTCTTELNFLTGYSTSLLPGGIVPYKSLIRGNENSLARFFSGNGYSTTALHPGYEWFYNRQNVYKFFGFDNIFFRKDMDPSSYNTRRGLVTDQDAMEFILEDFDKHFADEPQKPHFNFTVTIENHSPYNRDMYNEKILARPEGMTDEAYNTINCYLYGLRESDKALGYLVSELKKRDEPFVLVYYGDHLPLLNTDYEGYKALSFNIGQGKGIEAFLNNYETPFFIWSNAAAQEMLRSSGVQIPSGKAPEISACFLSAELVKYTGLTPSPFLGFMTQLEKSLPVITHKYYKQNGSYVEELSPENRQLLLQYRKLQYYMLFDDKQFK